MAVRLVDYDPAWPARYEDEARRLMGALGSLVIEVAHVGSTAVEGLGGKGTIDIAVGSRTLVLPEAAVARVAALGYVAVSDETRQWERRFRRGERLPWDVIVHVVEWGGAPWRCYLGFRDALRADPKLTAEYGALKRRLLAERGDWYRGMDKRELIERVLDGAPASVWLLSDGAVCTEIIAARLADYLAPGDVVTVSGELGSGKTTFIRGACRSLGVEQPVTSPTFTIGHRYRGRIDVSHLDLYRFSGLSAAEWGDMEPYFEDAVVFVEWPEAGATALPRARTRVELGHLGPERRRVRIDADDRALLEGLERADPGVRHGH